MNLKALAIFASTIIGVGIFGLPYVAVKIGFLPFILYFLITSLVVIGLNILLGKISLGTKTKARIPGYVAKYLGKKWGYFCLLVSGLALIGALTSYLIIGGRFIGLLLSIPELLAVLIYFSLGSFLIFRGIRAIALVELLLLILLTLILFGFLFKSIPTFKLHNLTWFNSLALWPIGAIIFSLWGLALVPEIKEMVKSQKKLNLVIISGIIIAVIYYLIFSFIIVGICGENTPEDALSGLDSYPTFQTAMLIFGILTTFTSFISLGLTLKKILWYDFGIPKNFSWILSCFIPLALYLAGLKSFIALISVTGGIFLASEGILVLFTYLSFKKQSRVNLYFKQKFKNPARHRLWLRPWQASG